MQHDDPVSILTLHSARPNLQAVRTPSPCHSNTPARTDNQPQKHYRPIHLHTARTRYPTQSIQSSLQYRLLRCKPVFLVNPPLLLAQSRAFYAALPLFKEVLLALRNELPISIFGRCAVREDGCEYLPAASHEPQVWPTKDPEECEVENIP